MTRDRLLEQAIELLAIADFHSPTLKEERNQVVREGIELLRQPKPDQNELKLISDQINYGMSVTQGGKRIDPMSIYKEPEQEPVGMVKDLFTSTAWERLDLRGSTKVYLDTPPQRTWVGLTDEEMHECWDSPLTPLGMKHARMIEAKLKQKNGFAEEKNT